MTQTLHNIQGNRMVGTIQTAADNILTTALLSRAIIGLRQSSCTCRDTEDVKRFGLNISHLLGLSIAAALASDVA